MDGTLKVNFYPQSTCYLKYNMLSWYYQILAVIEHSNIRLQKYFLIPILLVTACTASYTTTANDTITLLLLLTGLMYAFEIGTGNAGYRHIEPELWIVKLAPYLIFLLVNLGKLACACLLLFQYNTFDWLFVFINACVLAQTVLTFICAIFLTCLSCNSTTAEEYRECRRQMESSQVAAYDQILN